MRVTGGPRRRPRRAIPCALLSKRHDVNASPDPPSATALLTSPRLLLLAAVAGAAVMVLEIAAPRLVAPHVGTGALAWTVTIATFLAGLAAGNAIGGWLADRVARALLPGLLLLSGAMSLLTPVLHDASVSHTASLAHAARVLVAIPITFLPVSLLLGTVPPVLARALLRQGRGPGLRLGAIAALGAAASVAGTFLAGFSLVPEWGLRGVFQGTAALLAAGALLAPWGSRRIAPPPPRTTLPAPRRVWVALAVLAGAAILTLEILAGRMASARLGSSVYTWTSVIGVVLTGLALGSLVGGWLADRFPPRALLRWLFLAASVTCCLLLWAHAILDLADLWTRRGWLSWPEATLAVCVLSFLLPSVVLGSLSPVVVRAALAEPETDGRVVGGLYAAGTLGAVIGTVAVGYVLIPWAGLERLTLLLAFLLASASGTLRGRSPYAWYAVIILLAVCMQGPWEAARRIARDLCFAESTECLSVEDSRHSRIRVQSIEERCVPLSEGLDTIEVDEEPLFEKRAMYDEQRGRLHWRGPMDDEQRIRLLEMVPTEAGERAVARLYELIGHDRRQLRLDRLQHGYVDLQDPLWLAYGYERLYAMLLEQLWPQREVARCLFIGGGAYAFQRYLLARQGDGIRCVTVELDPKVTETARQWLGLVEDPRHRIVHEDARTFVADLAPTTGGFDLVFGDAFDHISVPFQLTTEEFARALEDCMAPRGIYFVNVVDSWASGRFLGAFVTTLQTVFANVRVVSAAPRMFEMRDTYVLVASNAPLSDLGPRLEGDEGESAVVYDAAEVADLCRRAGDLVLTDDRAPVEILLAPVLHAD